MPFGYIMPFGVSQPFKGTSHEKHVSDISDKIQMTPDPLGMQPAPAGMTV